MSFYDFNSADKQQDYTPIPTGTIVPLAMMIKPGQYGDNGWLTLSQSGDVEMLNCEFTVTEGPYTNRKIFQFMVVAGGKTNEKGESIAGAISRRTLRAMLESARNIQPDDMSDAAMQKRRIRGWEDFCGLCFLAKLGVEKEQNSYPAKNKIMTVITPNMKEYAGGAQSPAPSAGTAVPSAAAPAWAPGRAAAPASAPARSPAAAWATGQTTAPSAMAATPPPPPPPPAASANRVPPQWAV
jgi:hypothetical protein